MKKALAERGLNAGPKPAWLAALALVISFASGCGTYHLPNHYGEARFHPSNVYHIQGLLNPRIQRVAVLPLTCLPSAGLREAGIESLQPVVRSELAKAGRFEIVPVTTQQLEIWTGKSTWRSDQALPPDFFEKLRQGVGADAVLFCHLSRYQPYKPVAIGWKFNLVANFGADKGKPVPKGDKGVVTIWSADEVFDSGNGPVANSARDYYLQHINNQQYVANPETMLSSPGLFGQYSLAALFDTLPPR